MNILNVEKMQFIIHMDVDALCHPVPPCKAMNSEYPFLAHKTDLIHLVVRNPSVQLLSSSRYGNRDLQNWSRNLLV